MTDDALVSAGFDQSAFGAIARMAGFNAVLQGEMPPIMSRIGDLIVYAMVINTWASFANPTGALAGTISSSPNGPMEVDITVGVPYAWRMEEGFHGTDSLGRIYNQEGIPYAVPALTDNEDKIAQVMSEGMANVFAAMAGR